MPLIVAIGPWSSLTVPLMVLIPVAMIVLTRWIGGALGDDSFRRRSPDGRHGPMKRPDDEL